MLAATPGAAHRLPPQVVASDGQDGMVCAACRRICAMLTTKEARKVLPMAYGAVAY